MSVCRARAFAFYVVLCSVRADVVLCPSTAAVVQHFDTAEVQRTRQRSVKMLVDQEGGCVGKAVGLLLSACWGGLCSEDVIMCVYVLSGRGVSKFDSSFG